MAGAGNLQVITPFPNCVLHTIDSAVAYAREDPVQKWSNDERSSDGWYPASVDEPKLSDIQTRTGSQYLQKSLKGATRRIVRGVMRGNVRTARLPSGP